MGDPASPLHIATIAGALLWPLGAGVAVVLWSKARAAARAERMAAVDGQLKSLYRQVTAKPVPPQLAMVVDALEEGEELAGAAKAKPSPATAAGS